MEATLTATKTVINRFLEEFNQEVETTRKMLSRVPEDKWDWKPHAKSMTMQELTFHIADLHAWPHLILTTPEIDFAATPYETSPIEDKAELLQIFDESVEKGRSQLEASTDADLLPIWTMRSGDQVYAAFSKDGNIRVTLSQIIHHRAQLGVYLRLLDIPIPGSYGPSADEMNF